MILRSKSSLSFFCCSITIANCCCNFSTSVLRKLSALSLAASSSCSCSSNLFRFASILRSQVSVFHLFLLVPSSLHTFVFPLSLLVHASLHVFVSLHPVSVFPLSLLLLTSL